MTNPNRAAARCIALRTIEALTDAERRAIVRAGEVEAVPRIAALHPEIRRAMTIALCLW